ncbi:MAG: protein translocase subunit SecDF, partial [Muribaculaceae bacterium]|nr:protein translocase subunit SecDF [Muribaculaceae bacterium]
MDSLSEKPVYLGYSLNEVRKWGVGLGLDLKGGMNVILQVDMPEMLRSMSTGADSVFERALTATNTLVRNNKADDYVGTFVGEYRRIDPNADFSTIFVDIKPGTSADNVASILKKEVKDRVETSATSVLRKRIDQFGVVSPNIQVLQGKDGQILLELPGVKDHERVRELLQRSATLEFYETYTVNQVAPSLQALAAAVAADTTYTGAPLMSYFQNQEYAGGATVAFVADAKSIAEVNAILNSAAAKQILPSDLKLRWSVKPKVVTARDNNGNPVERNLGYELYALKTTNGKAILDGSCVVEARADYNDRQRGNEVSMTMNAEGSRAWARITTQAAVNKDQIAILLDDQVYSAPVVQTAIEGGSSQITGNFTTDEARDLANVLKSGKMTAKVN